MYPNLNGQWEKYLRKQLAAYRDGSRKNAIMSIQAQNLSDEDIAVLAAHYGN
jgi:cytochrome c553